MPLYAGAEPIELDQVISYLNSIETLGADFGQVNHDGSTSKGVLYIKKPGRLRMVYASPDTTVVIVNNEFVTESFVTYKNSFKNVINNTYPKLD